MNFADSLEQVKAKFGIEFEFKQQQKQCFQAIYENKDLLAVLPTGFGKSIIFQAAPFLLATKRGEDVYSTHNIILVLSPLNSIMMDQITKLNERGIKACYLDYSSTQISERDDSDDGESSSNIKGKIVTDTDLNDLTNYNIIYAHPESLISTSEGIAVTMKIKRQLCAIAIDEGHLILEWGEDFRKDFQRIGEDLVPLFNVPIMVFTATASKSTQQFIMQNLNLKNCEIIEMNPDRPNIKYIKMERPPSLDQLDHLDKIFNDIGEDLVRERSNYPLTILYSDTEVIGYGFKILENKLGDKMYQGDNIPENRIFAQYHANYTEKMKKYIVEEICKENSKIRIVLSTVALGMGLDARHVRNIIHYKPPTTLEAYFQETGRAGRDGEMAQAILYYNNTDIRRNRPGISTSIIKYCQNKEECLRSLMLSHFGYKAPVEREKASCCSICDH